MDELREASGGYLNYFMDMYGPSRRHTEAKLAGSLSATPLFGRGLASQFQSEEGIDRSTRP